MQITVSGLTKRFGGFAALDGIDLSVASGELVALLGPSGSGKTTLLRIIAGLETPSAGEVRFGDEVVTGADPGERGVGFVFQHYALFRTMSVAENVAFGLTVKPRSERPDKAEIAARVAELLRLVQLEGIAHRLPHQLSGGQRQRVALARALAVRPRVLLLDEPFGALDAKVRLELRRWLRRLHDETGITSVFVTHDQEEALEVADRVAVLNHGRLEQVGTPDQVYHRPASAFVHHFLGNVNVFHGRLVGGQATVGDLVVSSPAAQRQAPGDGVAVFVRPHDIEISRQRDAVCLIPATVREVAIAGPVARVELVRGDDGRHVEAAIPHARQETLALKSGDAVFIGFARYEVYDPAHTPGSDYQI